MRDSDLSRCPHSFSTKCKAQAAILVVVTATIGYLLGYLFALLWDCLSGKKAL